MAGVYKERSKNRRQSTNVVDRREETRAAHQEDLRSRLEAAMTPSRNDSVLSELERKMRDARMSPGKKTE